MTVLPHRPLAGGMSDHGVVGLAAMLFAVVVGFFGSGLSLLLLWPGLESHGLKLQAIADFHVTLLLFFSAVPALLGGVAVSSIPRLVGSDRSAYPWLPATGLGLTMISFCVLADGVLQSRPVMVEAGVMTLTIATIGTAADLIATVLNRRTIAYSALAPSVWTTLIAATFTVCAAPVMAAYSMVALRRGMSLGGASSDLVWPAICLVLVLMIGLISDILSVPTVGARSLSLPIVILTGCYVPTVFMTWATAVLHHYPAASTGSALLLTTSALVVPVEAVWLLMLWRRPAKGRLFQDFPALFATGFAVVAALGLVIDATGHSSHNSISLAIVFGLFASFFKMTDNYILNRLTKSLVQVQFWCLLAGTVILLLPQMSGLKAIGAALLSLSVVLFATSIVGALVWRFNGMARRGVDGNVAPRLGEEWYP